MPIFSIIVPVYKVEKYLGKCIESILSQTFTDFELILVDDGSPDKSGIICDEYRKIDNRIRVIHKENGGVSSARNKGIEVAKGKYISFVDSDDWIEKDYIEKLYNPSVDITICNINYVNLNTKNIYTLTSEKIGTLDIQEEIIEELIESRYISTVYSKSYRRDIIEEKHIRFNTDFSLGEDTMFVVDYIINANSLYISDYPIYNYIDYSKDSLSKFSYSNFKMLEMANEYIKDKLSEAYLISESQSFKRRLWSMYQWAIFEIVNNHNINILEKIKMLRYIFKNTNYTKLLKQIDIYMKNDAKLIRKILATKNEIVVVLFFKLYQLKSNIKNRGLLI